MALTQALDLAELQKVLTSDQGEAATALAVLPPTGCAYDAVTGNVPANDLDAAKAALDAAGWIVGADGVRAKDGTPLSLSFQYANALGAGGTAAAELATSGVEGARRPGRRQAAGRHHPDGHPVQRRPVGHRVDPGERSRAPTSSSASSPAPAAPDGANFASIDNADYTAAVATAMAMTGTEGCDTWKDAEAALYQAADVIPFANSVVPTFGKNAEFKLIGSIEPTSIRMLG